MRGVIRRLVATRVRAKETPDQDTVYFSAINFDSVIYPKYEIILERAIILVSPSGLQQEQVIRVLFFLFIFKLQ